MTLAGWVAHRRDHGGVIFLDLRDGSGVVQCVLREDLASTADELRSEFCLRVVGEVSKRPEGNENPELPSGEVEVIVSAYDVLSTSEALPFPIDGHTDVSEERRLRYRYLDLRSAGGPGQALRVRSKVTNAARRVMERRDFLEIETPYLTRSTPEGARDFLVPVRLQPGNWYALPQSPQLFKQLLMVAGMERYYQFARCFRDEDFRADRQPEFTQLDVEMSFCEQDDIIELAEDVLTVDLARGARRRDPDAVPADDLRRRDAALRLGQARRPLRARARRPHRAVRRRPTSRCSSPSTSARCSSPAAAPSPASSSTPGRSGRRAGAARASPTCRSARTARPGGGIAKFLREDELRGLVAATGASPGDAVFFQSGPKRQTLEALGALRVAVAKDRDLIPDGRWEFLWVTDAPMFEPTEGPDGEPGWTAVHHPFTRPRKRGRGDARRRIRARRWRSPTTSC